MATGNQNDMLCRIKSVLPSNWFPDETPVLDALLSGCAYGWAWVYSMIAYVILQARRLTATGPFLDMISTDFFGTFLPRRTGETDALFNARMTKELFREKGTRAGMVKALTDLTGIAPTIFEPAYTNDTGGWGQAQGLAYNTAGGYGNLQLPFQFFVTATRPLSSGIPSLAGYGTIGGFNGMPGGYTVGALEYGNLSMVATPVTDAQILAVINDVRPAATIAWTRVTGASVFTAPLDAFILDSNVLA